MAVTNMSNMTMNFLPPGYPIPNHNMMDFDGFSPDHQASFEDSESESNFTSDEFDSECAEDIHHPFVPYQAHIEPEPDIAQQLLHFADMVNKDIQKFFGKRKAIDDVDDDIKDRFASGKSGRELYYADLLKVAQQGDNNLDSSPQPKKQSERIIISNKDGCWDKKLGPLGELFEYASAANRTNTLHQSNWNEHQTDKQRTTIPWRKRSLPRSFFMEPQTEQRSRHGLTQDPPDFSDLMAAAADD
ncbi:protein PERCC1-like [Amphiura filiformis]|uniref:protein PERCC1-like n=1 Tax=Amphiura filiformis TaxID=82378 RepID=UPI003B2265DC